MSRGVRQLLAVSVAALGGALLVGDPVFLAVIAVLVLATGAWALSQRGGAPPEQSWSVPVPESGSVERSVHSPPHRLVLALGRVEAREFLLSPWFGVGLGLCVVMVIAFASNYDGHEAWWEVVQDLPFLAYPLVGMTVLAAHRAATRSARDNTAELFAGCPASRVRTAGALAAAPVPVVALALFYPAYLAVVGLSTDVDGSFGAAPIPTLLSGLVLGIGGMALGVALGRFVTSPIAPVLVVIGIAFASPALAAGGPGEIKTRSLFSTMPGISDQAPAMRSGQAWFHVAWLALLTITTAVVVVAGHRSGSSATLSAPATTLEPARSS